MSRVITVPDVEFSSFYYPEILKELLTFFRRNREAMGLTDENDYEVHVQLLRAFALVGHLNNCRTDIIAQEMMIDSLTLLESLKRLMKLIGVSLNSASPAQAELLVKLSEVTTADITGFIPELSEFSTESVPPITYEVMDVGGIGLTRTDRLTHVYGLETVKSGVGSVSTTAPDIFTKTSGDAFAAESVTMHLFIPKGTGSNGGEFRVTEFVDENTVRVVKVPGNGTPGFQTETDLSWKLKAFTEDFAVANYTPGSTYTPWATLEASDALYIGHTQCLFAQVDIDVATGTTGTLSGCWEYYDGILSKFAPTRVETNEYALLIVYINSLLGTLDRSGADVTVTHVATGVSERLVSSYDGENMVVTTGLLGQIIPSLNSDDYLVQADWVPLDNQEDTSNAFGSDGVLTYNFPQDVERSWNSYEVNSVPGWWLRYRVTEALLVTLPVIEELAIDHGDQFMMVLVTQGETVGPQVIGGSDGSVSQSYALPETPFLDESDEIEIDETGSGGWMSWTRMANFLNSSENSRNYTIETDAKDKATIHFGDGTNGKIPISGTNNIRATYRVGGDVDGNVGIKEISTNTDGISGVSEVYNPRAAYGWRMKDGGTAEDIERVKRDAPASLRTRDTVSTAEDCELHAVKRFIDAAGVRPVARAVAIEEGLGPKTIKLMVVGNGGTTLNQNQKSQLEQYFNGNRNASPVTHGVLVVNHQVTVFNYEPKVITIAATVTWPGGVAEEIRNALLAFLEPLVVEDDGVTSVWDFGGYVSRSRVYTAIHAVSPGILDVPSLLINGSTSSLKLGQNELPVSTAANITIHIQETI